MTKLSQSRLHLRFRRQRGVGLILVILMLAAAGTTPQTTRASVQVRHFWIQGAQGSSFSRCALQSSSLHADLFACTGAWIGSAQARRLLRDYESLILPTDLNVFGRPRNFGRTDILLTPLDVSTLGYFDENDIVPADPLHSNRANVLYVRPPNLMPDKDKEADVEEAVAHELQHLINFRVRVVDKHLPPQEPWLNEGLAFYAQMVNGFWTRRDELKVEAAAANPQWPIDGLRENNQFLFRHARVAYGRAGLFITDLASRYGRRFARSVVAARGPGLTALDYVLRRSRPATTLQAAFSQWGVDLLLNRMPDSFWDNRLTSHALQQKLAVPPVTLAPAAPDVWQSPALRIHPWSQSFVQFRATAPGSLQVTLDGDGGSLTAAVVAQSTRGVVAPSVTWCRSQGHAFTVRVDGLGTLYDRATLAVSDVPQIASLERLATFRIRADLVYASDHDRVSRPTAPARHNTNVAVGKSSKFN